MKLNDNFKRAASLGFAVGGMVFLSMAAFGMIIYPVPIMVGFASGIFSDLLRRIKEPGKEGI